MCWPPTVWCVCTAMVFWPFFKRLPQRGGHHVHLVMAHVVPRAEDLPAVQEDLGVFVIRNHDRAGLQVPAVILERFAQIDVAGGPGRFGRPARIVAKGGQGRRPGRVVELRRRPIAFGGFGHVAPRRGERAVLLRADQDLPLVGGRDAGCGAVGSPLS